MSAPVQGKEEWFDLVPRKLVTHEDSPEDDRAILLIPRFRRGLLAKYIQPRLKKPYHKVRLDEVGTFVWRQIDGVSTVDNISIAMKHHFGEKVEPVVDRLVQFLSTMFRHKFIELLKKQQ